MMGNSFTVVGSAGGPTYSPVFIVDHYDCPANIGVGVVVSGPLAVADVQHTFANPGTINLNVVSAAAWSNNATLVSATQANNINGATDTSYAFPPRAIRLRVRPLASASVGEQATITIVQAGS